MGSARSEVLACCRKCLLIVLPEPSLLLVTLRRANSEHESSLALNNPAWSLRSRQSCIIGYVQPSHIITDRYTVSRAQSHSHESLRQLHRLLRHLIPPDPIPHYRTRLLGLVLTKARGADMSIKTGCTTANVLIRGDLDRSGHGRTDFSIFHGQKPGNGASSRSCAVSLAHSMISLGKTLRRAS